MTESMRISIELLADEVNNYFKDKPLILDNINLDFLGPSTKNWRKRNKLKKLNFDLLKNLI